ncbi:hypothetical protein I7I51_02055 [Histoplasma capsulatum]|uniref:Uncharacterized protein n=1 Tax=Ajellomyces capsulatus TaxID=5037 RepID=A0A8A1MLM1_AJECA|nr:hypothetical protein I7I51_02055 [Histoplasma capsulatum]
MIKTKSKTDGEKFKKKQGHIYVTGRRGNVIQINLDADRSARGISAGRYGALWMDSKRVNNQRHLKGMTVNKDMIYEGSRSKGSCGHSPIKCSTCTGRIQPPSDWDDTRICYHG